MGFRVRVAERRSFQHLPWQRFPCLWGAMQSGGGQCGRARPEHAAHCAGAEASGVLDDPVRVCLPLAVTAQAFKIESSPESPVMAPIGASVSLTCSATGCEAPAFSWRTQIDSPLSGRVQSAGSTSTLTMDPVSFENEHSYLCTATCGDRKAERNIEVHVYCEYLRLLWSLGFALNEVSNGGRWKRKTSSTSRSVARGLDSCTQRGRDS